ncbi:3'-5' exonuclease [Reticulibacter mediterranei]|uniref:3'-5' exonuclease n=1 Tax=Reticulibacter mediterranei TaxID=2778369 RepID=UPI003570D37E
MNEGRLPHSCVWNLEELAEERHLAYVECTRAKDWFYLLLAARWYVQGEVREGCISRFLDDLSVHLVAPS